MIWVSLIVIIKKPLLQWNEVVVCHSIQVRNRRVQPTTVLPHALGATILHFFRAFEHFLQLGLESWSSFAPSPIHLFGLMSLAIRRLVGEWPTSHRVTPQRGICIWNHFDPHVFRPMTIVQVDAPRTVPTADVRRATIVIHNISAVS